MAHRRTVGRGLRLLVGTMFVAGIVAAPVAVQAQIAPAPTAAPGHAGTRMGHATASRVALVNPLRDGVARSAGSGNAFGVPTAATDTSGLAALRRPAASRPQRFHLPHWLPQRAARSTTRVSGGGSSSTGATLAKRTTTGPVSQGLSPVSAAAAAGFGLRSEFGLFGLSDADDSLLYPDCSVFVLCEEPPDPGVAASATSVVESVNELILVIDRATNGSRVIPNFDFFALDNNQTAQSDPRVVYDAGRGRWLATEISSDCGHGYLHLAVSTSDDPFGNWTVYRLVFPGRIVDFPGVGSANATIVVSLNAFGANPESPDCLAPGDFQGAMLAVVDWTDLEKGVVSLPVTTTEPDSKLFTWRPAMTAGGDPLARLIVAVDNGTDDTSDVGYATISGSNGTHDVTLSAVVNLTKEQGLAPFATPPPPHQPGDPPTITRAVDGQPTDAIAASGHLWFIATAPCTPPDDDTVRDCVRLTELLTGAGPSTVALAADTRFREKGADLYMGGVGRALDGTLFVVYSRSSATAQIAGWATSRGWTEDAFHPASLLIPGGGVYSGTRWGDYVILAPDPATPDAVWQADEVSSVDGTWFTWLSRIRPAPLGPLEGSFRLNGGDAFAGEAFVELQLNNPADVALTVIRVANSPTVSDGVLTGGQTLPVATDMPWSLAIDQSAGGPADGVRHVYVQWGDGLGHWSAVATDSIVLDTTPPTIGAVRAPRIGTSTLGASSSVPVEITWQAGRDALSGLEGYDVEISQDGGDWADFGTAPAAVMAGRVRAGHRYQWRVRAFDRLGNVSDWQMGPTVRVDLVDDASASIRYDSSWHQATARSAYRGGVHAASRAAATAVFMFTGRGFALVGPTAPDRGVIDVVVDGSLAGHFVEVATRTRVMRIGFQMNLAPGRHTVRLVAADGRRVDLDAVIVLR